METSSFLAKNIIMTAGVTFVGARWWVGGGFGIALKEGLACTIVLSLVHFSAAGATNEWTKPTSGYWEESYWSLGQMPGMDQELVAFRNPGWKALAIGASTIATNSASLSLNNLLVEAPTDSFNQLLLNWAGLSVPLFVHSNLTIGTNGSLASHYSALHAANAYIDGSASFSDYATEQFDRLWLQSGGTLNLTNGIMACSNLTLFNGTYLQIGGTAYISVNSHSSGTFYDQNSDNYFYLSGGTLYSGALQLGLSRFKAAGDHDAFYQSGGVHSNSLLNVSGVVLCCPSGVPMGYYSLSGGVLVSDEVDVTTGSFSESGGTNYINNLRISEGGVFLLSGGELVTSNTSCVDYQRGSFTQTGGAHTVRNKLLLDAIYGGNASFQYSLSAGTLNAANIEVGPNATLGFSGGAVFNTNLFTLRGNGQVNAGGMTNAQLGQLQLTNASSATLSLDNWPNWPRWVPTVLRFQDSHALSWSGSFQILSWHPAYHRVFIGTNSQALTSAQLNAITFVSPIAWPSGNYPATLLPSGELVPAGAQQADSYTYMTTNGAAIITGYTGTQPSITIPGTIGGFPVTAIGNSAFIGASILTSVTIGSGIQTIGNSAFESCSNLTSVTIANTVTNISDFAFYECRSMRTIALPDSVVALGDDAFGKCTSLTSAAIGNGLYALPDGAFYDCSSLTNITLGSGITNISGDPFGACPSLTAINVHPLNPAYTSLAGVLFDKNMATLIQYPAGKIGAYSIPTNVTGIGDSAFYSCSNLTGVTLASTVTNIGNYAFAYCTTLASLIIPDHVTNIGSYGFYDCTGLSSIVLGSGLAAIADSAFGYCTSLPTVAIPDSVTTVLFDAFASCINLSAVSIGRGVTNINMAAFYGCNNLTEINVHPLNPSYSSVDGVLFNKSGTTLLECPIGRSGDYTIPNTVTAIANEAFYGCARLTTVIIPNGVASIGYDAFSGCTSLTSVTIPSSVTTIGTYAFEYCDNLTAVYFAGNAPYGSPFSYLIPTVYYLPGTSGWGPTFAGCPTAPWFLPNPVILGFGPSFGVHTNRFGFIISWATNVPVVVEACTNLVNRTWIPIATNTLTNGWSYFSDPQWTSYPARFYHPRSP